MASAGVSPPDEILDDGKLHRFGTNGRAGDDSGWYILHGDGIPAGAFGDFRAGVSETFCADIGRELTEEERRAQRERVDAIRRQRAAEEARRHAEAAKRAERLWRAAVKAQAHPYLSRKGVKAHGLRLYRGELTIRGMRCDDALVIPLRLGGQISTLEFINTEGEKRFLPGGRKTGAYHSIGKPNGTIVVCEGYATGASVHEATLHAVAVAFDAGNLLAVAKTIRGKFPDTKLIIAGDHDETGVGQRAAAEAALSTSASYVVPRQPGQDWNDVASADGLAAVRAELGECSQQVRAA
jgi:putative DNA primase/helicase